MTILQERKNNKLRDYTTMTGPLGVTHLLLFSKSSSGNTNLRVGITPRGPTLHFRVENYSLMKDIMKSQKHPKGSQLLYHMAPLMVMNNFTTPSATPNSAVPKHLEQLVTTIFQSIFPPLNPQATPLASIKRVLLLNREPAADQDSAAYTLTMRHYAISTKSVGLPKAIKRLSAAEKPTSTKDRRGRGVPNLSKLEDVADWMLDPASGGYTSGSESEPDADAEVEVLSGATRKLQARGEKKRKNDENGRSRIERLGIKLTELGPRMTLRLMKVEEGLCNGKIMWHEYIHKTKEEERKLEETWKQRRRAKEDRKAVQRENLERKKSKRSDKGDNDGAGDKEDATGNDETDDDFEDWDSDMLDGAESVEDDGDDGTRDETMRDVEDEP